MQENEINFAIRGAKSIIIATDNDKVNSNSNGWFGSGNGNSDDITDLPEKNLKRLLNAVMNERNKANANYNTKVIALCKATKQSKVLLLLLLISSLSLSLSLLL